MTGVGCAADILEITCSNCLEKITVMPGYTSRK
ncbi:hypothetical protein BH10PSE19_BH10PSE19_03510 [soil metagenome]